MREDRKQSLHVHVMHTVTNQHAQLAMMQWTICLKSNKILNQLSACMMSNKNTSFELSDNEYYSTMERNVLAAKAPVPVKKNKMKCFMVAIVIAIVVNFLLVIGIGAALFYFQTNLTAEVSQPTQDNEGQSGMAGTIH